MLKLTTHDSWSAYVTALRECRDFRTGGALRGEETRHVASSGQLSPELQTSIRVLAAEGKLRYIVYSYATPIAWRDTEGVWYTPAEKYSVTTSKHQSKIFAAISML